MMSFCKGVASSRMMPRVPRHVGSTKPVDKGLTTPFQNVTINPIEGDQESLSIVYDEIQPHLNSGLWETYFEMSMLRFEPPPAEREKREAPGDAEKNSPVPKPPVPSE